MTRIQISILLACIILLSILDSLFSFASASENDDASCDIYGMVEKVASSSLKSVDVKSKKQLEGYYFSQYDPLYIIPIQEQILSEGLKQLRSDMALCVKSENARVDNIYSAIFKDEEWGARILILAMAQKSRRERLNLVDGYIGFLMDVLIEGVVPPTPPRTCKSKPGYSSARFQPSGVNEWFRVRYLGWVECADGKILAYLPEIGWRSANNEQIESIRASSPSCCRRAH